MRLKGMEKVREKLPAYSGRHIYMLPMRGLSAFLLGLLFLLMLDVLPQIFPVPILILLEPILPILGTTILLSISIGLLALMWHNRDTYRARYGSLSYQHAIKRGVMAVFVLPAAILHAFLPLNIFPLSTPTNPVTPQLTQSLLGIIVGRELDYLIRPLISFPLLIIGFVTAFRAVMTFGIDNMVAVYLFFPEESELCDHEIYSVIRHPTYFSGALGAFAAACMYMSVYSFSFAALIVLALRVHIRTEERELCERFGDSYREYKSMVPALYIRLRDIPVFLRFLVGTPLTKVQDLEARGF